MSKNKIVHVNTNVALKSSPINPAWILEGAPVARNAILSRSKDTTAFTIMWDCTAGKFNWNYEFDETVYILEGSVIVTSEHTPPRRLQPGDVTFFPLGSKAHWHVETYVRKIAYCRALVLPQPVALAVRAMRKARRMLRRPAIATGSLIEA